MQTQTIGLHINSCHLQVRFSARSLTTCRWCLDLTEEQIPPEQIIGDVRYRTLALGNRFPFDDVSTGELVPQRLFVFVSAQPENIEELIEGANQ